MTKDELLDAHRAELLAALRPADETSPLRSVQVEAEDGLNVLFYRSEEDGQHADEGAVFVPRALLKD